MTSDRFRRVPWARLAIVVAALLVLIVVVPPLRRAAAVVTGKVILVVLSPVAPDISNFDDLATGTRVLAADGTVLAELDGARRAEPVRLEGLPDHVPKAVLAAEDANFYEHEGVDPAAVLRAMVRTAQGSLQGGSTITQQLAKLNYTKSEKTVLRKVRELQYAVRLEDRYSKDELLERYLNQVYFGEGAYGISAAAQSFFGVAPEALSPPQAAVLAGKIKSPEILDPRKRPDRVKARRDQVLRNMAKQGWLKADELAGALAAPIELTPATAATAARAPHFVEYVKREAAGIDELGGSPESRGKQLFTGGYTVRTTLDPKAFDAAAKAAQTILGRDEDPEVAVATVEPGDGAIRVLYGGRDFANRNFDLASQGRRQPGSSFKPLVELAALRDGIDPRSTFDASSPKQLEYKGERYTVNNYEGKGGGRSSIHDAMTDSINTVFAQLILRVGPPDVMKVAENLGIADVEKNVGTRPAIALGGLRKGVTPLEQAAAFATFAARGTYAEPYAIESITDRSGRKIYSHRRQSSRRYEAGDVGVVNAAMVSVVTKGTGKAAAIGRPMAGKTGTTQNYGDAWFVGFVPQRSTAVWVGHPDKIVPMTDVRGRPVTGGSLPARIWAAAMKPAVAGLPAEPVYTASPDSLGLERIDGRRSGPTGSSPPSSATSSTLPPSSTSSSSVPQTESTEPSPLPTLTPSSTTTRAPARPASSTTSSSTSTTTPPSSSTTTATPTSSTTRAP
ncbi:MAG TPA: transglycosylase domain-containing protein [Acidimicrobiales bacterium]|nr:transglycosylase domain-containing protein [Acidimicrobiales bacterium]